MICTSLFRQVLSIAVPVSLKLFLDMAMILIDLYMIGIVGVNELTAISMGLLLVSASLGVIDNLFTTGGGILISRLKGAKRIEDANTVLYNKLIITVPLAILTIMIAPFSENLYLLLNCPKDVAELGGDYFGTILFGSAFLYLDVLLFTYFISMGNSRFPMQIKIVSLLVNIIFNYLFIFGLLGLPALGVQGAALGTVLATSITTFAYCVKIYLSNEYGITCRLSKSFIKEVLKMGVPSVLENFTFQMTWLFIIAIINNYSANVSAGFQIGYRVESIAFLPGLGAAAAATTLVSQFIGAGCSLKAKQAASITGIVTSVFMGTVGLLMVLFPMAFAGVFTNDQNAILEAATYIRVIGLTQIPLGLQFVYTAALRGYGAIKCTAIIKIALLWINIVIPSVIIVSLGYDVYWIYTLISFANIIDAIVFIARFRSRQWQKATLAIHC